MCARTPFVSEGPHGQESCSSSARARSVATWARSCRGPGTTSRLIDPWAEQVEAIRQRGISVTGPHDPFEAQPDGRAPPRAQRLPRDFDDRVRRHEGLRHGLGDPARDPPPAAPTATSSRRENCWPDPIVAARRRRRRGPSASSCPRSASRSGSRARSSAAWRRAAPRATTSSGPASTTAASPRAPTSWPRCCRSIDGAFATDNLWGERWSKLSANAMGNPVQAMSGLGSLEVASSEVGRAITIHLAAESARVGLALGYHDPQVQRRRRRGVGGRRPARDVRDPRPHADAGVDQHAQLARVDGAGRGEGPAHGDRLHERPRRRAGPRDGRPDAGLRGDGRDRSTRSRPAPASPLREHSAGAAPRRV